MGRRKRTGLTVAVVLAAASSIAVAPAAPEADGPASTRVSRPVTDAWVRVTDHRFIRHRQTQLVVGARPRSRAYLRFVLRDNPATVARATLRLLPRTSSRRGFDLRLAADTRWDARRLTFRSAPPFGRVVGRSGPVVAGRWIAMDVTSAMRGRTDVTFVLTTTDRHAIHVAARRSGLRSSPRVNVTFAPQTTGGAPPPATPPPPPVSVPPEPPVPPAVAEGPAIRADGSPRTMLTAEPGSWTGTEPLAYTYQWKRCDGDGAGCARLSGETGETHEVGHDDVGATMRVTVTASNAAGETSATSEPTPVLTPADAHELPPPSKPVTIAGQAQDTSKLTARPATWKKGFKAKTDTFQWQRCDESAGSCASIASATKTSYLVTTADVGLRLRVSETVTGSDGVTGTTVSAATSVVAPVPVHAPGDPIFIGAGDIGDGGSGANDTAHIISSVLSSNPGNVTVFTVGDNAYPDGSAAAYQANYDPYWGRFKSITKPVPGNHEYEYDKTAAGYFGYFGSLAGTPDKGYYAYDIGAWRIYAINSEISHSASSTQGKWLHNDLAAHALTKCVLAYWHEPLFAGMQTDSGGVSLWKILYDAGADVVLAGHDHTYERWAPMTPDGQEDPLNGITEFVVGSGGASLSGSGTNSPSKLAAVNKYGVLKLTLHPDSYDYSFMTSSSGAADSGSFVRCH